MKDTYSIIEAAEALNRDKNTIRNWIKSGAIAEDEYFKTGPTDKSKILIRGDVVRELIKRFT